MEQLIKDIIAWGTERNIIGANAKATLDTQFTKTLEEVNELGDAIYDNNPMSITDGIGDTVVTLVMLSELHEVSFEDCVRWAYNEIADRKGEMVDGTFVKEVK